MNKYILMTGKRWPPLALVMQTRDCILGDAGKEREEGDLFAGGF